MKRYVIADTHFNHKNIIELASRPFSSVEEMNEEIIKRWNSVVRNDDIIYLIGDFILGGEKESKNILSLLNGRKILIYGNHDYSGIRTYMEYGFQEAYKKSIMVENGVILMHEPLPDELIFDKYLYVYGHVHNKECNLDKFPNCVCVSCERVDYTPVDLDKLIREFKRKNG